MQTPNMSETHSSDMTNMDLSTTPTSSGVSTYIGKRSALKFDGTAKEYFGIWFVNIILTILTLGIYSAWAKVRRLRYFYGHTVLLRRRGDYDADPVKILKGRAIAILGYALYFWFSFRYPTIAGIIAIIFLIALPWLIVSSIRFNAFHTLYSGVRFIFKGKVGNAALVYFGGILITTFTLGLGFPIFIYMLQSYVLNNMQYGKAKMNMLATLAGFYKACFIPLLSIIVVIVGFILISKNIATDIVSGGDPTIIFKYFGIFVLLYLGLFVVAFWMHALLFKLIYGSIQVGANQFQTNISVGRLIWIMLSNVFVVGFSAGLMSPWAQIREYKYKTESLSIKWGEDPTAIITESQEAQSALGSEVSDLFDLDISV